MDYYAFLQHVRLELAASLDEIMTSGMSIDNCRGLA